MLIIVGGLFYVKLRQDRLLQEGLQVKPVAVAMDEDAHLIVFTTLPDPAQAEHLSRDLVTRKLVACAHLLPAGLSIYSWQGAIETATETQLILKTRASCYAALEAAIRSRHPYEVPEIIAVPLTRGLPAYLQWLDASTADFAS